MKLLRIKWGSCILVKVNRSSVFLVCLLRGFYANKQMWMHSVWLLSILWILVQKQENKVKLSRCLLCLEGQHSRLIILSPQISTCNRNQKVERSWRLESRDSWLPASNRCTRPGEEGGLKASFQISFIVLLLMLKDDACSQSSAVNSG